MTALGETQNGAPRATRSVRLFWLLSYGVLRTHVYCSLFLLLYYSTQSRNGSYPIDSMSQWEDGEELVVEKNLWVSYLVPTHGTIACSALTRDLRK